MWLKTVWKISVIIYLASLAWYAWGGVTSRSLFSLEQRVVGGACRHGAAQQGHIAEISPVPSPERISIPATSSRHYATLVGSYKRNSFTRRLGRLGCDGCVVKARGGGISVPDIRDDEHIHEFRWMDKGGLGEELINCRAGSRPEPNARISINVQGNGLSPVKRLNVELYGLSIRNGHLPNIPNSEIRPLARNRLSEGGVCRLCGGFCGYCAPLGGIGALLDFRSLSLYFTENASIEEGKPKGSSDRRSLKEILKSWSPFPLALGFVIFAYGWGKVKESIDGNPIGFWICLLVAGFALLAYSIYISTDSCESVRGISQESSNFTLRQLGFSSGVSAILCKRVAG